MRAITLESLYTAIFDEDRTNRHNSSFFAWAMMFDFLNWANQEPSLSEFRAQFTQAQKEIKNEFPIIGLSHQAAATIFTQPNIKEVTEYYGKMKDILQSGEREVAEVLKLTLGWTVLGPVVFFSDQGGREEQFDRFFYYSDPKESDRKTTIALVADGVGNSPLNNELLKSFLDVFESFAKDQTKTKEDLFKSLHSLHTLWFEKNSSSLSKNGKLQAATTIEFFINDKTGSYLYSMGDSWWGKIDGNPEEWDLPQSKMVRDRNEQGYLTAAFGYSTENPVGNSRRLEVNLLESDVLILATDGAETAMSQVQLDHVSKWLLDVYSISGDRTLVTVLAMSLWRMLAYGFSPVMGDNRTAVALISTTPQPNDGYL